MPSMLPPQGLIPTSTWVARVNLGDIEEYAGVLPGRQMAEIRLKIRALPTEGEDSGEAQQ